MACFSLSLGYNSGKDMQSGKGSIREILKSSSRFINMVESLGITVEMLLTILGISFGLTNVERLEVRFGTTSFNALGCFVLTIGGVLKILLGGEISSLIGFSSPRIATLGCLAVSS
jgi:hypothetical protein